MDGRERRSSFVQRTSRLIAQQASKRGMGAGYSLSLRINARFKPPKNVATQFRFLNGSFTDMGGVLSDYFQYFLHWSARTDRGFNCSKTWSIDNEGNYKELGGKCLGCQEMEREAEEKEKKTIDRRLMHVFNGIHLAYYHEVQAEDKQGKLLTYSKGEREGQPIMERQPCKGRVCYLCKQKAPRVFGKMVHYSMGSGHLESLVGFSAEIEKSCACGGRLTTVSFNCLKCGALLLDVADADMSDENVVKYNNNPQKCESCGANEMPMPEVECDSCSKPHSLTLFDVDVDIKRQGEGMKSALQLTRWVHKDLSDELRVLVERPMQLDKIFGPDPYEYQAKSLKINNPYKEKAESHAGDYGDEVKDPEADPEDVSF